MKCVLVGDLARIVPEFARAPTMEHAILLTDLVNVTLGGLAVTALSLAHLPIGVQTVFTPAIAIMELTAVPMMGSANVLQDGLAFIVPRDVPWGFMGKTVR